MGPVASQEAIKKLGTNGGGFFNANSAHPFENPTRAHELHRDGADLRDPGRAHVHVRPDGARPAPGLGAVRRDVGAVLRRRRDRVLGRVARQRRDARPRRSRRRPATWKARRSRFGIADSALFATVTTDASCGAVNSMHDSFTPLGGLVPLVNIQLGEVMFGGVGAGLYGMLVFVVLTVFIAGLMVGRTPEYLGKKIEGREMKLAMLYILVFPLIILGFTAWAAVAELRRRRRSTTRPARPVRDALRVHAAAPATTARRSPGSTRTPTGGTSCSASRCSPGASS